MKKLINFLLIGVLIYTLISPTETYAASWPATPTLDAKGAVIREVSSGTILYSKKRITYYHSVYYWLENIRDAKYVIVDSFHGMVLSIVFYDSWDGKLPEVLTSDSLSSMIGSLITNE